MSALTPRQLSSTFCVHDNKITMIKIRPHHLLDILRDYGNEVKRDFHPFGASLKEITNDILSDINQNIRLVSRVDSICVTCSKLENSICKARINDDLLMREYNDDLDDNLFDIMDISPGSELSVRNFLEIVENRMSSILTQFSSPNNSPKVRETGTTIAIRKLSNR